MRIARTRDELHRALADAQGEVGFVPTMGNLHAGHLKLVESARARAGCTVASVFVNPLQFGPGEDFESYPRTFEADRNALANAGVDILFAPTVEVMYPPDTPPRRMVVPESLGSPLEGASRPGHFDGVATVVARLFDLVRPDIAVFGEKDFQQLLVIRWLVAEIDPSIEVVGEPTVRDPDGLALSSRNQYLTTAERDRAPALYRALTDCAGAIGAGADDWDRLAGYGLEALANAGFDPDYFEVRDAATLGPPSVGRPKRVLAAARLGRARLIDNIGA